MTSGARYQRVATYPVIWSSWTRAKPKSKIWKGFIEWVVGQHTRFKRRARCTLVTLYNREIKVEHVTRVKQRLKVCASSLRQKSLTYLKYLIAFCCVINIPHILWMVLFDNNVDNGIHLKYCIARNVKIFNHTYSNICLSFRRARVSESYINIL